MAIRSVSLVNTLSGVATCEKACMKTFLDEGREEMHIIKLF